MKTKTKKVGSVVEPILASIKVFGRVYSAKGNTVKEAIEKLKVDGTARGTCVLTISKGDKSKDRIIPSVQIYRLFNGGRVMREIALKGISQLFEGIFV